jgi:hypothetical protein
MRKMLNWIDENEDQIEEIFAFGVSICVALGLIAMSVII